jgi:cytochrome c biogenesis protein CcmG, thiol:disulfide interchange protein DsbE
VKFFRIQTVKVFSILVCFIFIQGRTNGQEIKKLPSVHVKTYNGKDFNISDFQECGKPVIITFWASWCKPCIKELTAVSELYESWKEETGVIIYAISVDDSRTLNKAKLMINSKNWEFEFYFDINGDFKRAMGVVDVPHTFILNSSGEIIYQHSSYMEGSESEMIKKIREDLSGK